MSSEPCSTLSRHAAGLFLQLLERHDHLVLHRDLLRQAEGILLQRGPVLPIYHYARAYLLNPAVQGFAPHPLDQHPIKYIRKTR